MRPCVAATQTFPAAGSAPLFLHIQHQNHTFHAWLKAHVNPPLWKRDCVSPAEQDSMHHGIDIRHFQYVDVDIENDVYSESNCGSSNSKTENCSLSAWVAIFRPSG
jgi:hypothetical protein